MRCASMPFADEVIFNFEPGVAAGWFRALGALLVVAAVVDMGMEGLDNNARTGDKSANQAGAGTGCVGSEGGCAGRSGQHGRGRTAENSPAERPGGQIEGRPWEDARCCGE